MTNTNRKIVEVASIQPAAAYQVIQFENGYHGVVDTRRNFAVAFGMSLKAAGEWACRLNLRAAWGV